VLALIESHCSKRQFWGSSRQDFRLLGIDNGVPVPAVAPWLMRGLADLRAALKKSQTPHQVRGDDERDGELRQDFGLSSRDSHSLKADIPARSYLVTVYVRPTKSGYA
jgi:hypothetical protein